MKINMTVHELKEILSEIFGIPTAPEINMPAPELPEPLSDEEVHNAIVSMCTANTLKLYINEVLTYTTDRPNYDRIAEELIPYDGEIVSIFNKDDKWFINTL